MLIYVDVGINLKYILEPFGILWALAGRLWALAGVLAAACWLVLASWAGWLGPRILVCRKVEANEVVLGSTVQSTDCSISMKLHAQCYMPTAACFCRTGPKLPQPVSP